MLVLALAQVSVISGLHRRSTAPATRRVFARLSFDPFSSPPAHVCLLVSLPSILLYIPERSQEAKYDPSPTQKAPEPFELSSHSSRQAWRSALYSSVRGPPSEAGPQLQQMSECTPSVPSYAISPQNFIVIPFVAAETIIRSSVLDDSEAVPVHEHAQHAAVDLDTHRARLRLAQGQVEPGATDAVSGLAHLVNRPNLSGKRSLEDLNRVSNLHVIVLSSC